MIGPTGIEPHEAVVEIGGASPFQDIVRVVSGIRRFPGEDLAQNAAEAEDVGPFVEDGGSHIGLLRGEVGRRAENQFSLRILLRGREPDRDAPIDHFHGAEPAEHDVLWLKIPVQNTPGMGMADGLADLLKRPEPDAEVRSHFPPHQDLGKRVSFDQTHGEKGASIDAATDLKHRDNSGMFQTSGEARLFQEAAFQGAIPGMRFQQNLESHGPVQLAVPGLVNHAHAATGQLSFNPVPAPGIDRFSGSMRNGLSQRSLRRQCHRLRSHLYPVRHQPHGVPALGRRLPKRCDVGQGDWNRFCKVSLADQTSRGQRHSGLLRSGRARGRACIGWRLSDGFPAASPDLLGGRGQPDGGPNQGIRIDPEVEFGNRMWTSSPRLRRLHLETTQHGCTDPD